jgi:hypothetical protein
MKMPLQESYSENINDESKAQVIRYADVFDLLIPGVRGLEASGYLFSPSANGVAREAALAYIEAHKSGHYSPPSVARATIDSLVIKPFDDPHDEVVYA